MASGRLTALRIERAKARNADYWLSDDDGTRGGGRLVVRICTSGAKLFYFRYSVEGVRRIIPIRPFAAKPTEGHFTLEQARQQARDYSELHRRPESRDVERYLTRQRDEANKAEIALKEAAQAAEREAERVAKFTLLALCDWYVKHLERQGKSSAADARNIFKKHLAPTEFAGIPAKELTGQQATVLLRRLTEAGKGRTAGKLRAYMRAAYALAIKAELDASVPSELTDFGITGNPIAVTATLARFNRARDRVLSEVEMGMVWRRMNRLDRENARTSELANRDRVRLGTPGGTPEFS